jgi:hypothetical protein
MEETKMSEKCIARVTLYGAPDYPKKTRREIVRWLREQADFLENESNISRRFVARFFARG